MELTLYDTLTRSKRHFVPLDWEREVPEADRRVRVYVCGPTVYDRAHIGNARPVIVFDVLFRLLRQLYGSERVIYVRNVTDVEDKINARAAQRGIPIDELTAQTYRDFKADVEALGCLEPTHEPRATEHIGPMRELIERLIASNHAYVAEDHVLFSVPSMPDYGQLSKRPLNEMLAGARVEVAPFKRNPMDFVLWKPSNPGTPSWPSPAGIAVPGRPGWHIECSAMVWRHLGEMIDIHGGGMDLEFPHHENEIAQSRCAFTTPLLARFWVHNGFLTLEGDKMAKSVGNMVSIRQLLADWPGEVLRFNMLKTHYHQPMDWTIRGLEAAAHTLDEFYAVAAPRRCGERVSGVMLDPLLEDLNTPRAIAALHGLRNHAQSGDRLAGDELGASLRFLGFLSSTAEQWAARTQPRQAIDPAIVERLIVARAAARDAQNFAEADRLRDELAAMGVRVKDTRDGTTWEIRRS